MKSKILVFLLVLSFMLVGATSSVFADPVNPVNVFLGGVDPGVPNSYTDAEKNKYGDDDPYCWAAAASNVLAWTEWDAGFTDEDAIFANFQNNWTDDYGSWPRFGLEWWFTGGVDPADPGWILMTASGTSTYTDGGGHYNEAKYNSNVMIWEDISDPADVTGANLEVKNFIDYGYATALGLYWSEWDPNIGAYVTAGAHSVTMFGYQYDTENADYLAIWISDSDNKENTWPPGTPDNDLLLYPLESKYGWGWYLDGYPNHEWWIGSMAGLLQCEEAGPGEPVPEPATIFLLGSGLAGLFGIGRRKFKRG